MLLKAYVARIWRPNFLRAETSRVPDAEIQRSGMRIKLPSVLHCYSVIRLTKYYFEKMLPKVCLICGVVSQLFLLMAPFGTYLIFIIETFNGSLIFYTERCG
jgi:hypothetical protein